MRGEAYPPAVFNVQRRQPFPGSVELLRRPRPSNIGVPFFCAGSRPGHVRSDLSP